MKNIKKMYLGIFLTFLLTIGLFNGLPINENAYAQEDNIVSEEAVTEEETASEGAVISDEEVSEEVVTEEKTTTEEVSGENEYDIDENAYASLNEVQRASLDQIKNAPKSEVKVPKMKMGIVSGAFLFKDGTPSFTAGSGIDGNDNSEKNQIVRSYDNIVYQVDFGFNGVEATDLVVEATVPADQGEDGWYEWDNVIMELLEYDVELSADGRTAKIFFDKYEVGQGSSVKVPLAVYGALNGSVVEPTFKVYVANEGAKPENIMAVKPVTVSAKPNVNVQIPQTSLTTVSKLTGEDKYSYTYVFVPLQVSLASAGGKGSEPTAGTIGFDVDLTGYIASDSSMTWEMVEADTTKYETAVEVVDYGLVNSSSKLPNLSIIGSAGNTGNAKGYALAGSLSQGSTPYYSVYDSGVMSATQNGNTVSVKFDNPVHNNHNRNTSPSPKNRGEIPFISGGLIVKVQGKNTYSSYNSILKAEVSALTEGSAITGGSIIGQNTYTDDDTIYNITDYRTDGGRHFYPHIQSTGKNASQETFGKTILSPTQEFTVRILSTKSQPSSTSESKFVQTMNFDPRVMELVSEKKFDTEADIGKPNYGRSHLIGGMPSNGVEEYYKDGAYKLEYGVSSDCSEEAIVARKGLEDVPSIVTNPYNNVTWYDTIEEAKEAETGTETGADGVINGSKLCAARMTLEPGFQLSDYIGVSLSTYYKMKVRNNGYTLSIVDTGMTSMITQYSMEYYKNYDFNTQTGTFYEVGAGYHTSNGIENTDPKLSTSKYIKPIYNANDEHINPGESNHKYGGRGNVFRLEGYNISISKSVLNDDGSSLSKDNTLVPRIDNTIKWTLSPKTSGMPIDLGNDNPVTVTDTLPAGLKVNESSITPKPESVVYNANGTTTMTWKYYNVTVGEQLEPISYVTEVDRFSKDGMSYTNKVNMSVQDKTASASKAIRILDDSNFIVEKAVDNKYIDKDEDINYTLTFQNRGTKDEDVVVYDILPYNGDNDISKVESGKRATSFNGTFEVTSHSTDATNYEVIYSFDENIKTHTLDEATFKTEEEWGAEFDLSKVTIIGYKINGFKPQAKNNINISIKTNGNKTYDVYENNYSLWFTSELNGQPVQIPLNSNTVKTEVLSRTITGTTWIDSDVDGLRQEGEALLPNVPVKLFVYDETGNVVPYINDDGEEYSTVTDENGFYKFTELKPGKYLVGIDVEMHGGKKQTLTIENTTDLTLNSDAGWLEVNGVNYAVIDAIDLIEKPEMVDGKVLSHFRESNHNDAGVIPLHEIELEKSTEDVTYIPGQEMTYKVKVSNVGNAAVNNVIVADDFADPKFDQSTVQVVSVVDSAGVELVEELYDATDVFSIVFGTLPVGESYTITYTVNIRVNIGDSSKEQLVNTVSAVSDETEMIVSEATVDPVIPEEVELTKTGMTYFGSIIAMLLLGLIVIARMIFNKKNFSK